jgi:hypothetical protein
LLIPLALLAAMFVRRQFMPQGGVIARAVTTKGFGALHGSRLGLVLGALATLYWSVSLRSTVYTVARELGFALSNCRFLTWGLVLPFGVALAALAFHFRKMRIAAGVMLGLFLGTTLTLDSVWYLCAGYSVRDASREIGRYGNAKGYIVGPLSFELSLENRLLPIWTPWTERICYNRWFGEGADRADYLAIAERDPQGKVVDSMLPPGFPTTRFASNVSPIGKVEICPELIRRGNRFSGELYRCASVNSPTLGVALPAAPSPSPVSRPIPEPYVLVLLGVACAALAGYALARQLARMPVEPATLDIPQEVPAILSLPSRSSDLPDAERRAA